MKLNLECGNFLRNGYLNINSYSSPLHENVTEDTKFAIGNFKQLEPIIGQEKVEEIIFNLPLNVLMPDELLSVLQYWKQILVKDGILKVVFIDIRRVARATQTEEINIQETHTLIFGNEYNHKSVIEANIFKSVAKALKYTIESMSAKDFFVSLELKNDENTN